MKPKKYYKDRQKSELKVSLHSFRAFGYEKGKLGYLEAMQKAIDELKKNKKLRDVHFRSVNIKHLGMGEVQFQVELVEEWLSDNSASEISKELP